MADSVEMENITRKLINTRMRLLPYLYNAFARYHMEGIPPFRPLLMDFPMDAKTQNLSDQYMMGDNLLVAPLLDDTGKRKVYFPPVHGIILIRMNVTREVENTKLPLL